MMKKKAIVQRVAEKAGITRRAAQAAVDEVFGVMTESLARGDNVSILGFGRFSRKDRPAREVRKPGTGERIAVGPSASVSFKAGKFLRDALN